MPLPKCPDPLRRRLLKGAVAASITLPMINVGRYTVFAATPRKYSARAIRLIERSLVIDMLAPLKLDFSPAAYSTPVTEQQATMFRESGITGFHNALGIGGPQAYELAL